MSERCAAVTGRGQCRASKDLARTMVTVFRSDRFKKKIPGEVIIFLCSKHLRLSPLEWLIATCGKLKPGSADGPNQGGPRGH